MASHLNVQSQREMCVCNIGLSCGLAISWRNGKASKPSFYVGTNSRRRENIRTEVQFACSAMWGNSVDLVIRFSLLFRV